MSVPEFVAGDVIDGKYTVEDLLGHSGPLATYRAIDPSNQQVAIKVYDPHLETLPEVVSALARSETITRELPSGGAVARILDGGKDPVTGAPYTVTLFDPDPPLREVVAWTPLSPADMITFVRNLATVLSTTCNSVASRTCPSSRRTCLLGRRPATTCGSSISRCRTCVEHCRGRMRMGTGRVARAGTGRGRRCAGPASRLLACALLGFLCAHRDVLLALVSIGRARRNQPGGANFMANERPSPSELANFGDAHGAIDTVFARTFVHFTTPAIPDCGTVCRCPRRGPRNARVGAACFGLPFRSSTRTQRFRG